MDLFSQQEGPIRSGFQKHILAGGELWVMPNFLSAEKAAAYYRQIKETINWRQEKIKMYGKTHPLPRLTAWHADAGCHYKYAGILCRPDPWTPALLEIKQQIEQLLPRQKFNSVLLNLYRDGHDKMGWHADDEKELGVNPTIASVSLGAIRRFDLKHRKNKALKLQIALNPGSLLLMTGGLQHHWLHQVPAQKRVRAARINLTYRKIIGGSQP